MKIYLVVMISALSQIGFSGSRVAVSLHALELTANHFAIGVVIALYSLCPMLLSIVIGKFADRAPPRLPVILGSAAMTAALILPPLFHGLGVLCVTAFVLGLAHQVFSIPLEAVVGGIDGAKNRARNYAFITMGWSAANFLGPLIAGFTIDYVGQLQVYLVLAALTAAPIPIVVAEAGLVAQGGGHACRGRRRRQCPRPVAHAVRAHDHHCRRASWARRRTCSSSISPFTATRSGFRRPPSERYSAWCSWPLS